MSSLIVKPIELPNVSRKKPLGYEMFPDLYSSIYICAGTKSGKTTLINHILEYSIDERTTVYIYCPTVEIDPTYEHITRRLAERDIKTVINMHYLDDHDVNVLEQHIKPMYTDEPNIDKHNKGVVIGRRIEKGAIIEVYAEDENVKKKKYKYSAPKRLFLFDDLAEDMRDKVVYKLLSKQRHFKAKTIISTQSVKDLMPKAIKQLFYCIVFGGQTDAVLKDLYEALAMRAVTLQQFMQFYKTATAKKYDFLYIDIRRVIFKRNFTDVLYSK